MPPPARSELVLDAIRSRAPRDIVTEWVIEATPFIFDGDRAGYLKWKDTLGKALEVDARELVITGSACVGISLNPNKNFRAFHEGSDIDVAVISAYHFETAWRALRRMRPSDTARMSPGIRASLEDHRQRLIYWGTIATDKIVGILPFAERWLAASSLMARDPKTLGRDVKFRIYRDFDSFRAYLVHGVRQSKETLLEATPAQ